MGENLEQDVAQIKEWQNRFEKKFDIVYTALVGNEITKDGGLVADMSIIKQKQEKWEKKNIAKSVYVSILWSIAGGIAMYLIIHILK